MVITRQVVVLQYGQAGEHITDYTKVHATEAGKFVELDSASGGYPYATNIESAHDFHTEEGALKYSRHFPGFKVRHVKITYEVSE